MLYSRQALGDPIGNRSGKPLEPRGVGTALDAHLNILIDRALQILTLLLNISEMILNQPNCGGTSVLRFTE